MGLSLTKSKTLDTSLTKLKVAAKLRLTLIVYDDKYYMHLT